MKKLEKKVIEKRPTKEVAFKKVKPAPVPQEQVSGPGVYRNFLRLVLIKFGTTRPLHSVLKSKGIDIPEYLVQNWKQTGRIPLEHVFRVADALNLDPWVLSFEMMTKAFG